VHWPSGAHLQESLDAIRALAGESPDFSRGPNRIGYLCFPAVIVAKGPNKEANYTDERYWAAKCFIDQGKTTDTLSFVTEPKEIDPVGIYTVVNRPERQSHSHLLQLGQYCLVEGWLDHSDPQQVRFMVSEPATPFAPVSLSTTAGANSTTTATATYTYSFTDPWTGLTVTGATPTWGRPPGPLTGAATHGMVYRTGSTTSLLFTDEQAAVVSCT
jgi:hypothetical protein